MTYQSSGEKFFLDGRHYNGRDNNTYSQFHGEVHLLRDGRVLGSVFDSKTPRVRDPILGLFSVEEGIKFCRMQPKENIICPTIYDLNNGTSPYKLIGSCTTVEDYQFLGNVLGLEFPELVGIFDKEIQEISEVLERVERSRIEILCEKSFIDSIKVSSNTGQIFLRRF